jgi:single-strand DNA-binding protein
MNKIAVSGLVATTPRHLVTQDGLPITSFRLASTFDKVNPDGTTTTTNNWYTITSFRQLAINAAGSISKGDKIVVSGELYVRDWDNGERTGTSVEIDADSIGLDLSFGIGSLQRIVIKPELDEEEAEELERELQPA